MSLLRFYFRMSRPLQLLAIFFVFTWGASMAVVRGFSFAWPSFWTAVTAGLLISISIHYANEYADVETDRITRRTPFSGGSGVLPESGLPPVLALRGAWIFAVSGVVVAVIGVAIQLLPFHGLTILGTAILLGWGYSLKPIAFAWRGWGELDNAFLGGILLPSAILRTTPALSITWVSNMQNST